MGVRPDLLPNKRPVKAGEVDGSPFATPPNIGSKWEVKPFGEIAWPRLERVDPGRTGGEEFCVELEHIEQGTGRLIGYTKTSANSSIKTVFQRGDVLFGKLRAYLRKYWLANRGGVCSTEIWALVARPKLVTSQYLFQLTASAPFIEAASSTYGTHMPRSDWRVVKNVEVTLPPILEQEAIARMLTDADALVESLEQLLSKKRQIKQSAMEELLTGKKRLSGFHAEWTAKRLGELGSFVKGRGVTRDQANSGNLACVRYGEIYTKHSDYIRSFYSWISEQVALTATRLQVGDILFAGSGETKEEIGKSVAFVDDFEAYAGGDILILRTQEANPLFLGYYLNTASINRQKASRGQGDAVVHISSASLADIQGRFPDPAEQAAIATILADMDADLALLEIKLAKVRNVKQGMMQELLTGKIRVT